MANTVLAAYMWHWNSAIPLAGAVHAYQTVATAGLPPCAGSPGSAGANWVGPETPPQGLRSHELSHSKPVTIWLLAKSSLAGRTLNDTAGETRARLTMTLPIARS